MEDELKKLLRDLMKKEADEIEAELNREEHLKDEKAPDYMYKRIRDKIENYEKKKQ